MLNLPLYLLNDEIVSSLLCSSSISYLIIGCPGSQRYVSISSLKSPYPFHKHPDSSSGLLKGDLVLSSSWFKYMILAKLIIPQYIVISSKLKIKKIKFFYIMSKIYNSNKIYFIKIISLFNLTSKNFQKLFKLTYQKSDLKISLFLN